jgi:hypothetical protein
VGSIPTFGIFFSGELCGLYAWPMRTANANKASGERREVFFVS